MLTKKIKYFSGVKTSALTQASRLTRKILLYLKIYLTQLTQGRG